MSFSLKVKNEVCRYVELSKEEAVAELSGIMRASGTLGIGANRSLNFKIITENPAIARLIFKLLKEHFDIHTQVIVKRSNSLKKNNVYIVMIKEDMNVKQLLLDVGILTEESFFSLNYTISKKMVEDINAKRAYIRGAFLGGGSISNPEKTYHLEFVTHNLDYANELSTLINGYGLSSKVIQRKSSYVVYIKEGEQIVDLLNIIGAHSSLLQLENIRIMKEMRNNVNRLVNCETANLSKTVNAAVRQIESIKLIQREIGLNRLAKNLREIAELRLDYPDESLKELGAMLNPPVGKSGVNHRLRRIEKIAEELRKEEW
ncbi:MULTISPECIES: DNA-binding protein WhiA [Clostridium]|uniref:Probable cell division protein WhiA n=1 Tax=Clostridium senegalense TaxID=1465809 RepID=A0A6M0H6L4_9CLOT|nr:MULTISPECIES: DNA-binding protein WhiA [Clostridium]NEU05633.1 DNA-binding protein WhiA [Clostridium senegalense]